MGFVLAEAGSFSRRVKVFANRSVGAVEMDMIKGPLERLLCSLFQFVETAL